MSRKNVFMVLLSCIAFCPFGYAVNIEEDGDKSKQPSETDSLVIEKKQKAIKCLYFAAAGLHNVVVDYYKDAIRIISTNPSDTTCVLYQPESHAPEQYIEIFEKELFQSEIWKFMENRMIEQRGEEFYENIINSYDNIGLMSVIGSVPTKEQWINRFILPNLRSIYTNNLYWDTIGPRIEGADIPYVIEALNEYVKN